MAMSCRRTLLTLAITGATSVVGCKVPYRGDGTLSDRGELNRPRYIVSFGKIPIFEVGTHQYHFSGLPHEQMTLVLQIDEKSSLPEDELKSLQTSIEAALVDGHGHDICKSSRRPGTNDQDSAWVLSGSRQRWLFWNWQCHNFETHPQDSYELTITVTRTDPRGERIFVTPALQGGGLDFP